jgi:succinylglutamate desuccinylase
MKTEFNFKTFPDLITPGNALFVSAAVHGGTEHQPPTAVRAVMNEIIAQKLTLARGTLTCVPVANPQAYDTKDLPPEQRKRQIDENLNLIMGFHRNPEKYEETQANNLSALIQVFALQAQQSPQTTARYLDLHTTLRETPPHILIPNTATGNLAFAQQMGFDHIIISNRAKAGRPGAPSTTTTKFANSLGIPAITIECGQHDADSIVDVAQRTIMRALAISDIIEQQHPPLGTDKPSIHEFFKIHYNDEIQCYADSKGNPATGINGGCPDQFRTYQKGEPVAILNDQNNTLITAPENGTIIIMPNNGKNDIVSPQAHKAEQFTLATPYAAL